jgi:nucleoside-diphosphate-sugar epimerase
MEVEPLSRYAEHKVHGEQILLQSGLATILRLFNVYGSSGPNGKGVVSRFMQAVQTNSPLQIAGDGSQMRDFVYMTDIVRAFLLGIEHEGFTKSDIFNIGTGSPSSIRELATLVLNVTASNAPLLDVTSPKGEVRHSWADSRKAELTLQFKAKIGLEQGLRQITSIYEGKGNLKASR